ncbi:hypothetical protein LUZ60_005123 [Juncus effusus]|nr:hypothetical protein LUZ60_005123 [Juncus effusus]
MAKKLGKRARKFARKNLQSVDKTRRKQQKPFFKRKPATAHPNAVKSHDSDQNLNPATTVAGFEQNHGGNAFDNNLENLFLANEEEEYDDFSDSDGYLSEDPECPYISESENETSSKGESAPAAFKEENTKISLEISKQKKKLEKLLKKDPEFANFLETRQSDLDHLNKMGSDEESESDTEPESSEPNTNPRPARPVTQTTAELWCWLATEDPHSPSLSNLLNTFRSFALLNSNSPQIAPGTFSTILNFVLVEFDAIIRARLGIAENCGGVAKVRDCREVKLYLRACVGLLSEVTDGSLVCFVLERIRVSVDFFGGFPSLAKRLIKILVNFWASGDESLSKSSILLIKDICSKLPSEFHTICMNAMYKTFISRCKFVEESNLKHIEFLMESVLEIFALDLQKSYPVAASSLRQLAAVVQKAIKSKKEEDLSNIETFQFINCLDLCIQYICFNYKQKNNLDQLFSLSIKIIIGLAQLFPGRSFLPLRVKCVKMLNELAGSSGVFIPILPLMFDCFNFGERKEMREEARVNLASLLKVPRYLSKSRTYQDQCTKTGIELLIEHLSQWSYHISFPELCNKPLVFLKNIQNSDAARESAFKRQIERLINQIESNRDFIQMQRDQVSFSPNDQLSVENFLLLEKSTRKTSFSQFFASILQNSQN